jgi:iron complex outermembrane recepter protein
MRSVILATAATLAAVGLALADPAGAAMKKQYVDVPAQDLSTALQQLMKERELHAVYISEDLRNLRTGGIKGHFTASEALQQLLSGTGLTYQYLDEKTVTIVPIATAPAAHEHELGSVEARRSAMASGRGAAAASVDAEQQPSTASGFSRGLWQRLRLAQTTEGQAGASSAAEENAADDEQLDEIVVTAQRREQNLVEVPISISVLDGASLDRGSEQGVIEALTKVPGVGAYEGFQTGGAFISIRGVNAMGNVSVGASPIGYYIDMAPFQLVRTAIAPDASAYDLERVEVLRGPQGTLFGAGSQNGTVRILTREAELNEVSAKARVALSSTEDGSLGYRGDAALNIPVVTDKLGLRLVGGYQDLGGWIDRPNEEDSNNGRAVNLRLRADAKPTPELSISSLFWLSRTDLNGGAGGSTNETHRSTIPDPIDTDFDLYGLKASYDFAPFTAESSTSYLDYGVDSTLQGNFTAPGANVLTTNLQAKVFTQELILSSRSEGMFEWTAGAMYRDAEDILVQYRENIFTNTPIAPYVQPSHTLNSSESYAVFGEVTAKLADGFLDLTAGARFFHDQVGVKEVQRQSGSPTPASPLVDVEDTFEKVSPRAVVALHPGNRSTIYASYSEGFRSGFEQSPALLVFDQSYPPISPDNVENYEIGAKGELFNGMLSAEAALYRIKWTDVQLSVSVLVGASILTGTLNAGSATGTGFDAGLTFRPLERLSIGGSFSVNSLELDRDVLNQNAARTVAFFKGDRLPLSPKYTAGADLTYAFSLGGWDAEFRYDASYASARSTFANVGGVSVQNEGDDFLTMNARFAVEPREGWRIGLFVNNVNDKRGYIQAPLAPTLIEYSTRSRPRTIGAQLDVRF